jgi:hypothetical protein
MAGPLVHFRTPTYRRPETLLRTLQSMQAQTVQNWICDVYDNDPEHSARGVVQLLADPRIHWKPNPEPLPPAANIDRCYTRENPHDADWFCSVEDDDYILPTFVQENIEAAEMSGACIVMRNQIIELDSGTPVARLSDHGVLDQRFREGLTPPTLLRLALLAGLSISNGGLFWSRHAASDLEIKIVCSPVLQEYLRTLTIVEPIYIALRPLAVWAKKGAQTSRYQGDPAGYFRRELDLKRSLQRIRQEIWQHATPEERSAYISGSELLLDTNSRARELVKALIRQRTKGLPVSRKVELVARGLLIRALGRTSAAFETFISSRWHDLKERTK